MTTTDKSEWVLLDTDLTTRLGFIPDVKSHLYFEINEPGSGNLDLPLDSNIYALVTSGMFCECSYRGSSRGGFFIDNIKLDEATQGEDGKRMAHLSGRGPLALLNDAIVWDDGSGSTSRDFTTVTKASILKTLIDEAQARGGLANLSYDFTASLDSDSVAWTDSETYALPVGTSLLDIARQFSRTGGFDFEITLVAGSFLLSAYASGIGTDKSSTVYMRAGVNCEDVSTDQRGDSVKNAIRVKYKAGYLTVSDSTSITNNRRREKLLSLEQAQTSSSATTYASAKLAQDKDPKKGISLKVYDGMKPNIFLDYILGDTVTVDVKGSESSYRILGIQADFEGDFSHIVLELNTLLYDNEMKMAQELAWLNDQWVTANDANETEISFWAALGSTTAAEIKDAIIYNGFLYVCGDGQVGAPGCNGVAQYEIATGIWSALGSGFTDPCTCLVEMGGDIFVGVTDASDGCTVWKWNGSSWSSYYGIGAPGNVGMEFTQLIADGNDLIMAGRVFSAMDDQPVLYHYVASSTNTNTYDIYAFTYSGSAGTCNTLAFLGSVLHTGWSASGSDVFMKTIAYAGAHVYTDKILDPVNISAISGKPVTRLMAYGSDLLIAYQDAGASGDAYLGLWDGSTFTLLGTFSPASGLANIKSIFIYLTDIYVGGNFTSVDGVSANHVAKYSGGSWSSLTNGVGAYANAVVFSSDLDLYVGGGFSTVDGTLKPADHLGIYFTDFENMLNFIAVNNNVNWGDIGGTLSNQTDLQTALDAKSSLAFKTIAVSGQSDVVADTKDDTLTLVAGSNITITTNAGADSVTIASSGSGAHTIQEEGTPLTARANLNFVGDGILATDDSGNNATIITVDQQTIGDLTQNSVAKTVPVDADRFPFWDSVADILKYANWLNLKNAFQSYFDTLYAQVAAGVTNGDTHQHDSGDGGHIPLAGMANLAANSIIGNNTGSAATPIALSIAQTLTLLGIGYGTWTPTGTTGTNVASMTVELCHYIRVGDEVYFHGAVQIDTTAVGAFTCYLSLPIASNFNANDDANGNGTQPGAGVPNIISIREDQTNDRLQLDGYAQVNTNVFYRLSGGYIIK